MTTPSAPAGKPRTHPMIIAAAVAVLLFCAVGIAAVMGWLPSSNGGTARNGELSAADQLAGAPPPSAVVAGTAPAAADVEPSRTAVEAVPAAAPEPAPAPAPVLAQVCGNCGVIESVSQVTNRAEGSGVGAAGGAVVGGLLGNQVGGGHGRQLATIAGAIGGAVAGNQIEGHVRATTTYSIRVRMENGKIRTLQQSSAPGWQSGDRVRVVNGQLRANG